METNMMIVNIPLNVAVAVLVMTAPIAFSDHFRLYLCMVSLYCLPETWIAL